MSLEIIGFSYKWVAEMVYRIKSQGDRRIGCWKDLMWWYWNNKLCKKRGWIQVLKSSINIREATCYSRELKALRLTENYMQVALRSLENICSISRFLGVELGNNNPLCTHTHTRNWESCDFTHINLWTVGSCSSACFE